MINEWNLHKVILEVCDESKSSIFINEARRKQNEHDLIWALNFISIYCVLCSFNDWHIKNAVSVWFQLTCRIVWTIRRTPPNLGGKWGCVLYSECSSPGSRGRGGLRLLNILTHFLLQNFFFLFSYSETWVHLMVPKILYVYKRFQNDILVGSPAKAAMLLNYTKSLVTV